ncbi:hypothetical protein WKK05_28610 [Nostoc sp. UHCC 0302]|uniref:hypothetical protein n=1 Tax=Nostoc sp. UHCC 0302 TaxID=3134896 RepID=UPI00311CCDF3
MSVYAPLILIIILDELIVESERYSDTQRDTSQKVASIRTCATESTKLPLSSLKPKAIASS